MKKMSGILLVLCLWLGTATVAAAQDQSGLLHQPPKILTVNREVLKPGKGGAAHERTESAFVRAMTAAKASDYYIALDSLTGVSRTLFLSGASSFAEWEKTQRAEQGNATLSAALDRAVEADGDLLQSYETATYIYNAEQSNEPPGLAGARYFEIEVFTIKPGHESDWDAIVKLVKPALMKANPEDHWAMYDRIYGGANAAVVMRPLKSAAEIDHSIAADPKFFEAMGEDGMRKLGELSAIALQSVEANLFAINPRISYVSAEMAGGDPFWKAAKTAAPAAAHKKEAEKPAQ